MKNPMSFFTSIVCLSSLLMLMSSCQEDELVPPVSSFLAEEVKPVGGVVPTIDLFSNQVNPYGRPVSEWIKDYYRYMMSIPASKNPILDPTGAHALTNQTGPVVFLAGSKGVSADRRITLTSDKAILFPVISVLAKYPDPTTALRPAGGQTVYDFLRKKAAAATDRATDMKVTIDGLSLLPSRDQRTPTNLFYFVGNGSVGAAIELGVTGQNQAGVVDGYWVMLKGLSPGIHTIQFAGAIPHLGIRSDVTYTIEVKR
jgi:hypothetical protein